MVLPLVSKCPDRVMLKICLKYNEFEGIRNPSKIEDILGILAVLDDDFDVPDWAMVWTCPEGVIFKICLNSNKFEGIKNPLKDQKHF